MSCNNLFKTCQGFPFALVVSRVCMVSIPPPSPTSFCTYCCLLVPLCILFLYTMDLCMCFCKCVFLSAWILLPFHIPHLSTLVIWLIPADFSSVIHFTKEPFLTCLISLFSEIHRDHVSLLQCSFHSCSLLCIVVVWVMDDAPFLNSKLPEGHEFCFFISPLYLQCLPGKSCRVSFQGFSPFTISPDDHHLWYCVLSMILCLSEPNRCMHVWVGAPGPGWRW